MTGGRLARHPTLLAVLMSRPIEVLLAMFHYLKKKKKKKARFSLLVLCLPVLFSAALEVHTFGLCIWMDAKRVNDKQASITSSKLKVQIFY
jgi:nitrate reductase NapE component